MWNTLKEHGIDPAPERYHTTWTTFLRSQAHATLAADFCETKTPTGVTLYVLAVIEHATRRVQTLGATAHPTADWVAQLARNTVMDLHDAGTKVKFLIRDRDARYPATFDTVLQAEGIEVVQTGIRIPRMNAIMERRVRTCRSELLDRTLISEPGPSTPRTTRVPVYRQPELTKTPSVAVVDVVRAFTAAAWAFAREPRKSSSPSPWMRPLS